MIGYRRLMRQARRQAAWDRLLETAYRPLCWLTGHRWLYKMDLHGGALCGRCRAYRAAR